MKYLLVAMFAVTTVGVAYAGDMQDTENLDFGQQKTDEAVKHVAQADSCGGAVSGKLDRPTFKGDAATGVAQYCMQAVEGVAGVCEAMPTHKKDILKAVKSVTCHYDAKLTDADNHAVRVVKKGTNVDVYFNKDSANISESVREYLKKNL